MCLVIQSCPTLCNPIDCSLLGSSVHGILQAIILELLPFPSPRDLPDPGIESRSPTLQVDSLLSEPPGKSLNYSSIVEYLLHARHSMIAISFNFISVMQYMFCIMWGMWIAVPSTPNLRHNKKNRGLFLAYFPILEQFKLLSLPFLPWAFTSFLGSFACSWLTREENTWTGS